MSSHSKLILVTGATGFLGSALCRHFDARGYVVRALVRDPGKAQALTPHAKGGVYQCSLPDGIDAGAFEGEIGAVIHCAWTHPVPDRETAQAINIEGSRCLLELSRGAGAHRFVFVSTLSAHEEAESLYGQSKLSFEGMLDHDPDLIVRPGLVVGNGGLFARMRNSLDRLPLVPLFYGGRQQIQFIHVEDLCEAFQSAVEKDLTGKLDVAVNEPIDIRRFYRAVASDLGKECRFVRLPGSASYWLLRLFESARISLPVSSENLLGLKRMRVFDTTSDLAHLGIEPAGWGEMNDGSLSGLE
jgi:nucleoside-diphosphate-sugar epimerase